MKLKQLMLPAVVVAMMAASCNAQDKKKSDASMKNEKDSISYGLGVSIGNNFKTSNLDSIDVDLLAKGMRDVFAGKPAITQEEADKAINAFMMKREKVKGEENVSLKPSMLLVAVASKFAN
jgi:FKBP-type peptidyl-prolyl cis-trans isomerase